MQDSEKGQAQLVQELQVANGKYESLFEGAGDSIFIVDAKTLQIIDVNTNAARRLGYNREQLLHLTLNDIEVICDPDTADDFSWTSSFSGTRVYECEYRREDGSLMPAEVSSRLTQYGNREVFQNFVRDITERKQAEQQRLELMMERERTQILADFITQASHEFRTPLAIISTGTYLLRTTNDFDRQQQQIEKIESQVKHIDGLINALTTMAKLDSVQELITEEVDLCQLITAINENRQQTLQSRNIHCILEFGTQLLRVPADVDFLQQAIEAVVDNAIRFTPQNGKITVRAYSNEGNAIIEINDTGIGIGDDDLPHIFERFYRVDKAGTTRGFGMGLPFAKRVLELHQGRVEVESVIGKGSTFRFLLPVV